MMIKSTIIAYSFLCISTVKAAVGGGSECPLTEPSGSDYCPDGDGVKLHETYPDFDGVYNIEPTPYAGAELLDMVVGIVPLTTKVSFSIKNVFPTSVDIFVGYKKAYSHDHICEGDMGISPYMCSDYIPIEAECMGQHTDNPFAVIDVTVVGSGFTIADNAIVDYCCHEDDYYEAMEDVFRFTFVIPCTCPPSDVY